MTPSLPADRRSHTPFEERIQQSLTCSWKEGIAAQVMITIIDTYITPFALFLGATNPQIGALVAVPNLLGSVCQVYAVDAVQHAGSRLRLLLRGFFLQALFLVPIGFLALAPVPHKLIVLTGLVAIYKATSGLIGPTWGSLVSEYLPAHRRGDYFGWRSRILGITSLASLTVWGAFIYLWKAHGYLPIGFFLMFLVCAGARFVSLYLMSKHVDLPFRKSPEDDFTFWMFLRRFRESNFVKFVFYIAGITFATNVAGPYFSVHMLRDLHFDYLSYMMISLASTLTSLIAFPIWGRHADHVGNARILRITGMFLPLIPLPWMFFHHWVPLYFVESFAGFVWGGFNLCAVNYIYDAVTPAKRVQCLGYFNLFNGLAIFAGASIGGWLSARLPPAFGFPLVTLFLISSIGRLIVHLGLSRKFTEVRSEVKPVSSVKLFFSVVGIQPMVGRASETNVLAPDVKFGSKPR